MGLASLRAGLAALAATALLGGAGCATPTQLIVVVDTDLAVPSALDDVEITVSSDTGVMASEHQSLESATVLPLTLSLVPAGDFLGPIDVVATGRRGGTFVVDRRARVTLLRGETRMLRLHLVASCVGVDCGPSASCGEDGCAAIERRDLPPWPGSPPRLVDAGTRLPDAGGVDAFAPDAALDVGPIDAFVVVGEDAHVPVDAWMGCMTASECDDGLACTIDTCRDGTCVNTPDDDECDDGEACTDDRCEPGRGCVFVPNTDPCDDSVFCNGFDRCAGGSCAMHGGDPCAAPTVCDEAGDQCRGCLTVGDCPAPSFGSWGACAYGDSCDESAERTRTARTYMCVGGSCVPDDTTESEPCTRDTDGTSCGVGSCGSYGTCDYADSCDESGSRERTCTDLACAAGVCRTTNRTESMPCTRDTDGTSCGTTTCGSYGSCDYAGTCDEDATRSRTCMDRACSSGSCGTTTRMESMPCTRDTDGTSCGMTSCGSYGACDYSGTCDENATQTRTCTDLRCGMGSCGMSSRMESMACTRDTDGTSCGSMLVCRTEMCVSCAPSLSGAFGTPGTSFLKGVTGSGANLTFTDGATGMPMGSITATGATFSGSGTAPLCIWQVIGMGSTLRIVDWDGTTSFNIAVSGASVSGTVAPPCTPSPYGCFPPCLARVIGSGSTLQLDYGSGVAGSITFGCP